MELQLKKSQTDLVKHSQKTELESGKSKPIFVSAELYYASDLTYTEVYIKCKELCVKKMININYLTIQGWYLEFLKAQWDTKRFNQRLEEMITIKTYGERIDVAMWFEAEALYTPQQVNTMIQSKINSMISQGDRLLKDQNIELELHAACVNLEAVKLAVARQVKLYYDSECEDRAKELFDEVLPEVLERLNLKKVERTNVRYGVGTIMKMKLGYS